MAPAKDIDAAFVAHYSESSGRYFDELSESLTTSKFLAQWRPLLDECVQAYGQALYRVTVPCLLSVLEGAVVAPAERARSSTGATPTATPRRRTGPRG
jgi:hypothetical protein